MRGKARWVASARTHSVSDSGFSLVELLVTMMIFLVLALMVGGMMISVTAAASTARAIDTSTRTASNAMNEIARMIRAATENPQLNPVSGQYPNDPALLLASPVALTLSAYVNLAGSDETPLQVNFTINASNQLVETIWPATTLVSGHWSFSTTPISTRILADNVAPGAAIFSFAVGDGTILTAPTAGLSGAATLRAVRAVTVTISVLDPVALSSAVSIQNTIGMPNLGLALTAVASS